MDDEEDEEEVIASSATPREELQLSSLHLSRAPLSVLGGALAGVLLLGAAIGFLASQPDDWSAEGALAVLPADDLPPSAVAGFYETLSRGQVTATYAEVLRSRRFQAQVRDAVGPEGAADGVGLSIEVVPETALISVTATAPSAALAEEVVATTAELAEDRIAELEQPYDASTLEGSLRAAERRRPPGAPFVVLMVVASLITAIAVQQLLAQLQRALAAPSTERAVDGD